jgi:UDP-N-acetyl-D-galactosamine dehydrogenase
MKIAIIGLGYVGLALLLETSNTNHRIVGYDISKKRIHDLRELKDSREEFSQKELSSLKNIELTSSTIALKGTDLFIVTVPTPITKDKKTDLSFVNSAVDLISPYISNKAIIVFESTVYPGCTIDHCGKRFENNSGLKLNEDFAVGFSPERVVPGKKNKKMTDVVKLVSASSDWALHIISEFYKSIIPAGIHICESIEIAEASKLLENIQRDVNIALINEVSNLLGVMNIPTLQVIKAASTKWNFARYEPGLVGGHCIAVDPYYLIEVGEKYSVPLELCKTARKVNDNVKKRVFSTLNKIDGNILCLGVTFKENCSDIRESMALEIIQDLKTTGKQVSIFDPYTHHLNTIRFEDIQKQKWDCVCIFVRHDAFVSLDIDFIKSLITDDGLLVDLKEVFDQKELNNLRYWSI